MQLLVKKRDEIYDNPDLTTDKQQDEVNTSLKYYLVFILFSKFFRLKN